MIFEKNTLNTRAILLTQHVNPQRAHPSCLLKVVSHTRGAVEYEIKQKSIHLSAAGIESTRDTGSEKKNGVSKWGLPQSYC